MLFQESETVELKEIVVDEIKKEIIAFANCNGGRLYIGVRDDGEVIGLDDPDRVSLQISNMVRDAIKPDVTMFLHYETIEEKGKKIIEEMHFDSDPEVKAFIGKVQAQRATVSSLTPHILEWLKDNNLTDKIRLRF